MRKRTVWLALATTAAAMLALPTMADARTLFGVTTKGSLVTFDDNTTRVGRRNIVAVDSVQRLNGLPPGVRLVGIDYRPRTGQLFGVGTNSVVYNVNANATAVPAGGPFPNGLSGSSFGIDFNPVSDRIRSTSNLGQNLSLNPTNGNSMMNQAYPAGVQPIGAGYTNSQFTPQRPASTSLLVVDGAGNALRQVPVPGAPVTNPLGPPRPLGFDVLSRVGFDVVSPNTALLTNNTGQLTAVYRVNLATGQSARLARVGLVKRGRSGRRSIQRVGITGLAAIQDIG